MVFACFTYLLSDNQTANEEGKVLDDETFAEIQECITRNKIGFSKEIFEEGAEEQIIKDDPDNLLKVDLKKIIHLLEVEEKDVSSSFLSQNL